MRDWRIVTAGAAYVVLALLTVTLSAAGVINHYDARAVVAALTILLLIVVLIRTRRDASGS